MMPLTAKVTNIAEVVTSREGIRIAEGEGKKDTSV